MRIPMSGAARAQLNISRKNPAPRLGNEPPPDAKSKSN